ncbi:ABC transporter [Methylobacillus sp. MM3]|uniref:peptidase domain-containing ABC transporter n=1 Tax=Methylobacillus sp. MM3 TaxID=1848039 RepID=UPI0007DFE6AC|nr:peptidase domain-containing ABC transporter [Methylobacillus sp. MM3]OAJ72060.1 ABC transporter [Methylobacillus sp. MM3]
MNRKIEANALLWVLGSLCRQHRIPFDPTLLLQQIPPSSPPQYTVEELLAVADKLGLQANEGSISALSGAPDEVFPCLIFLRVPENPATSDSSEIPPVSSNESGDATNPQEQVQPALIIRSQSTFAYFTPQSDKPQSIDLNESLNFLPSAYGFFAKPEALKDEDVKSSAPKKEFGFSWFIPELRKHRKIWYEILLASLTIQIVGLATPLFTQVIIDKVIVHQTNSTLIVIGVALVMFMLFTSAMTWLRQYLVLHTGNRMDAVLGTQVFRHLLRLPLPYFEHRSTGTLVARLHGVETIREFISGAAITLLLDFPFMLIFLAVMFAYSWQLSLIAVGILLLVAGLSAIVTPVIRERINQQFMLGARNQAFLTEHISGMSTVKSLQMEPDIERKYSDLFVQYLAAGFSTKQVGNTYNVIANGLEQVMTLSILMVGALLVMQNDGFTVGMLVAFQMFAGRMSQPMLRLVGLWQEFQQANIAVKRLGDILDLPQEPHTLTPNRENITQARIDIAGIGFRYSENHPWLYRNLNMTLKPGHLTVLMGPSGCGKSTLAKLLLGFYLPQEGQIKLDGKDIRYLAANELRLIYGVVPQETELFSGTIYDNLLMANPRAGFEDIITACKAAEIHDVIEQLPKGYQTEIGERGTGLSGGQKQRLAISRALLKRPKILIFDEAVSNLDQQTAEHFSKTINRLKGKVTMLFITHQIPKGLQVDEVFSFGNKQPTKMEVVEDGINSAKMD